MSKATTFLDDVLTASQMAQIDDSIAGAGGGGKGGGGSTPTEAPNSLQSKEMVSFLDLISEGPIGGLVNGAQSIYFNDTPLQNADGTYNFTSSNINNINDPTLTGIAFAWDSRNGVQDQTPISGFSDVESPTTLSVKILHAVPYSFTITDPTVDAVRIISQVPSLTQIDTSNGNINGTSVQYQYEIAVNSDAFVNVSSTLTISGKSSSVYQEAHQYDLPKKDSAGNPATQWVIRMTRITPDSTSSSLSNDLYLAGYIAITYSKLAYPNSAIVGVTIDSSQFNQIPTRSYLINGIQIQVPSNYDPVARTYTGTWDGTFKLASSNNPAWVLYDLLTNTRYGLGQYLTPSQIDKAALYQIGQYCDGTVSNGFGGTEPRFTCNVVINKRQEAYKLISDIASIFRGIVFWSGGLVGASQDSPQDPTMVFTAANVVGGLFNYSGAARKDLHSTIHVTWNDPQQRYQQVIEYVEDTALVQQYGIRDLGLMAVGCTSRGQAHRVGLWALYTEQYEADVVSFSVGLDSALVLPGDIVQIEDATRAGKRMGGRLVSCTATSATLDAPVTLSDGPTATLSMRLPDGTFTTVTLNQSNTTTPVTTVTWTNALTVLPLPNAIWIIAETNLQPFLARVVNVKQNTEQGVLDIQAVSHNPSKYAAIDAGATLEPPQNTILQPLNVPVPTNLSLSVGRYTSDTNSTSVTGILSWSSTASSYIVTWQPLNGSVTTQKTTTNSIDIPNLLLGTQYTFNVTAVSALGFASQAAALTITPASTQIPLDPIPTPATLTATGDVFSIDLAWTAPSARTDLAYTEIWASTSSAFSSAVLLSSVPWPNNTFQHQGLTPGSTWYYWIRVVAKGGTDGGYYPSTTSPGVSGSPSTSAAKLLTQLTGAIGLAQAASDLATPVNQIPGLNSAVTTLQSQVSTNTTDIANNLTSLNNEIAARGTAITNEATTRANADTQLSQQITTLTASSQGAQTNLVTNPGFVVGGGAWPDADMLAATASGVPANAPAPRVLIATGTRDFLPSSPIVPVQPGDMLDYEIWVGLATTITQGVGAVMYTYDSTGAVNGSFALPGYIPGNFTGWQKVSGNYTVPASVYGFRFGPWIDENLTGEPTGLTAYFAAPVITKRSAALAGAYSGIQTEASARASADTSLANQITTLTSTVNTNNATQTANLSTEASTRASADTALSNQITTLNSTVNNLSSTVTNNYNTLSSANSATASEVNALSAQVSPNNNLLSNPTAALGLTDWTAVSGTLNAFLGSSGEGYYFQNGNATSANGGLNYTQDIAYVAAAGPISIQAMIFAAGITMTSGTYAQARVYVEWLDTNKAHLGYSGVCAVNHGTGWTHVEMPNQPPPANTVYARVHIDIYGDGAWSNTNSAWRNIKVESGSICTNYTDNTTAGAINAAIQNEASTRASADSSLASQISTLTSTVNTNNSNQTAALSNEATTRASADSANASAIQTVQSNLNSTNSTLATVQSQANTNATNIAATSSKITTVQASLQQAQTNIAQDPGFTKGLGVWPDADIVAETALPSVLQPAPGTNVLVSSTRDVFQASPQIAVVAGDIIDLECWVGIASTWSAAQNIGVMVLGYDVNGNMVSGSGATAQTPGNFTGWKKVSGSWLVPSGTVKINVDLQIEQGYQTEPTGLTGYFAAPVVTKRNAALASVVQTSTANASAINGLSAKYTLQVDANGHVAGMELASGAGQSQIVLLANALAFYTGSSTYPLLSAGNVNGVSSVGINGQLIVDGSITANAINGTGLNISGNGKFTGSITGSSFATGSFTGYAWPAAHAGGGSYLDSNGLLLGNYNNWLNGYGGGYFQVDASGNVYAPGFSIVNGTMTLPNAVIGTAQIQNGAVTSAQIGSLQVQTANIANLNVDGSKITGIVSGSVNLNNAITPGTPTATVYTVSGRFPLVSIFNTNGVIDVTVGNGYFTVSVANGYTFDGPVPYVYI